MRNTVCPVPVLEIVVIEKVDYSRSARIIDLRKALEDSVQVLWPCALLDILPIDDPP